MTAFIRLLKRAGRPFTYLLIFLFRCPYEAANTVLLSLFLRDSFRAVTSGAAALNGTLCLYALGFLALYACNGAFWTINGAYAAAFGANLRKMGFAFLSERTLPQMESRGRSEWITLLNADTDRVTAMLTAPMQIVSLGCGIAAFLVSSFLMARADVAMFALVFGCTVPHVLISSLFLARPMRSLNAELMRCTESASSRLIEMVECALPARAYAAEEWQLGLFEEESLRLRRAALRVRMRSALGKGLMLTMGMGGYLAAIALGAYSIRASRYQIGELVALFQLRGGVMLGAMMSVNSAIAVRGSAASAARLDGIWNER